MKEKMITKKNIKRIILIILLIVLFSIIFAFSNQDGESSTKVSKGVTEEVTKNIKKIQQLEEKQKQIVLFNIEVVIRKLAHFSLYTCVGLLLMSLMDTFNLKQRNKILCSLSIGLVYAISDEIHQLFIAERTAQIMDVMIDTLGVLVGIGIVLLCTKIIKKVSIIKEKV